MSKEKFGISVDEDIVQQIDELADECDDLQASRSEIIEAILTAYLRSDADHVERVRELIIRRRKGTL
ncbi:MAG: ribbon-helix-helix protein, CopG family [Halobacteriales archaeon]